MTLYHARVRGVAFASTSLTLLAMLLAGVLLLRQRQARSEVRAELAACPCCEDLREHAHVAR